VCVAHPLAFLAAVAMGTGGGVLGWWRWRARGVRSAAFDPAEGWDAEDCVRRAEVHLQAGRLDRALEWSGMACRRAPTSAVACALHAFLLERLGRVDEALASYAEASRLGQDGEPALCAARLAAASGRGADEVERLLADALARSPGFVEEAEGEPLFRRLRGRPRFESAVETAWSAHAARLSRDDG
jgi:tetratricopeptide (TPR) repeat protein